ncbi:amine sulfotransferase-like [Dermacentor andersoni]|uniref:amine sulfotransferase-like n=1 Tax=Dermacentor andersoni TaxID=34620 RepID=UPI002155ADCC|nr:amine sulfotransferase-like [Dermacentor andersoni]
MPESRSRHVADGAAISKFYPEDSVRSALCYQPAPDDIFVVTHFPQSGGDWVQEIIYYIFHERAPPASLIDHAAHLPHLEMQGSEAAQAMPRPGSIRTHLPFHLVHRANSAKYIYVARNPYDCSVFFFEQLCNSQGRTVNEAFEAFPAFFEKFVEGRALCGDYLTDLLSWYERRFDDNVLFLTYEELVEENKTSVLRIADFLDQEGEHGKKLRRNRKLLEKICAETRHWGVWECVDRDAKEKVKEAAAISDEGKPDWVKRLQKAQNSVAFGRVFKSCEESKPHLTHDIIFTPDMMAKLKERIMAAAGTTRTVMNLWQSNN